MSWLKAFLRRPSSLTSLQTVHCFGSALGPNKVAYVFVFPPDGLQNPCKRPVSGDSAFALQFSAHNHDASNPLR